VTDPILIGISLSSADTTDGAESTEVSPEGSAIVSGPAILQHVGWIYNIADDLGLVLPPGDKLFRAGQVFFDGGVPSEVRLSLLYCDQARQTYSWERSRTRAGAEHDTGPATVGRAPDAGTTLARSHVTLAVTTTLRPDMAPTTYALVWDLRENARVHAEAQRARQAQEGVLAEDVPFRVPQGFVVAAAAVRSHRIESVERVYPARDTFPFDTDSALWAVIPSKGTTLVLPFEDASGVTVATVGGQAHLVLSGGLLMSYLTTWALWNANPDPAGRFLVSASAVADFRGWTRHGTGSGATYGKPLTEFRSHVRTLEGYGIKATAEIKARSAEPLIQFYERAQGGTYYRHAPILVDTILSKASREPGGFAQVPVRALRLGARDGAAVIGLAALLRAAGGQEWRGSLRELAVAVGSSPNEARRGGRAFWVRLASDLAGIVRDGGFGTLEVQGTDPTPDTPCVVTPSPELEAAYLRLHEARDRAKLRADAVEHEAAVRRKLPPKRRHSAP
jgi:hypothetical protein